MTGLSRDFKFKRAWERQARNKTPGVLIFGPLWGWRYSRSWDRRDFRDAEKLLEMTREDNVLDVGCGPLARAEVHFGRRGFNIVGVDVSAAVASQAKKTLRKYKVQQNVDLVVADAEFLPFRTKVFSKVLAAGLIVHLPSKRSVARALQQFRFCMKKNGLCYIIWLPNLYSLFGPVFKIATRLGQVGKKERIQILNFKGLEEIRQICRRAGFKISREFHSSILWIGLYLLPNFTHRIIEKTVSTINQANNRNQSATFMPYSFDVVAQKN